MRAGVLLTGVALLLGLGYGAIQVAQGWKKQGPVDGSAVSTGEFVDASDPHAPPRLDYWPTPVTEGPRPRMVVEPAELDFGRIAVGGQRDRQVVIANTGEGPLEISQGSTTCEATLSDQPGETLPPGDRRIFVVRWNPSSATEGDDQFLEIRTNDPVQPKIKLTLKGRAAIPLAIVPNSVWELPSVTGQARVERTGWLTSNLVSALEVGDMDYDRELLEITSRAANPQRLVELEALSGVELVVSLKPSRVYGVFRVPVRVRVRVPANAERGDGAATEPAANPTSQDTAVASPREDASLREVEEATGGTRGRPAATGGEDRADEVAEADSRPAFPEVVLLVTALRKGPIVLVGKDYDARQGIAGLGSFPASEGIELPLTMRVRNAPAEGLQIVDCQSDPPGMTARLTSEGTAAEGVSRYKLQIGYPAGGPTTQRLVTNPGSVRLKLNHPEVEELILPLHLNAH